MRLSRWSRNRNIKFESSGDAKAVKYAQDRLDHLEKLHKPYTEIKDSAEHEGSSQYPDNNALIGDLFACMPTSLLHEGEKSSGELQ